MKKAILWLHRISLIKYPILLTGLVFVYKPLLFESEDSSQDMITGALLLGFALSLEAFKDQAKLTWLDKQIYHRPQRAKWCFIIGGLVFIAGAIFCITYYQIAEKAVLRELSLALLSLSIGGIGLVKSGMQSTLAFLEKEDNHQ